MKEAFIIGEKQMLLPYIEQLRRELSEKFNDHEDVFIIDSMPLGACKNTRASRCRRCKEESYSATGSG